MSRGYYNGGYNHACEVDQHHRYEEIPDIDPSMDFLQADDTSASFYYMESPTRLRRPSDAADPAERTLLLRAQQHNHYQQLQQLQMNGCPPPLPAARARRNTPPSATGGDRSVAAVTPCKARRRLDVYGDASGTVSLPSTPSGAGRTADVFAPMMAQTAATFRPVTVRRARSSAALYNKHKRPPEFLSEYNLDTCVPVTGVQYDRPRNTAVIQPIYNKAPLPSVFQVEEKTTPHQAESPAKPSWSRTPPARTPVQSLPVCTLWSAAMVLVVSGTASCMLCFYLMSRRGRLYYLNAGLLAAAVCLVLGFPGFRSQQWRWLPNRNYVTGYILVALFSALETCALWLMCQSTVLDPALNDIGAGVVCGISALSVTLACLGISTSYCCRYPPPDNRVAHAVEGFVV
eukprot:XP_003243641.1 PREDICTED: uncharacterized protein LOC100572339 [Acyrthosiphon pisum]